MKKSKRGKTTDMSERDFLSAMYEEDMPTQNCVSAIYEHWEKMREQLPTSAKAAITKKMKFYQRIAKIDPKALPMMLAIDPEYNPSLNQYVA